MVSCSQQHTLPGHRQRDRRSQSRAVIRDDERDVAHDRLHQIGTVRNSRKRAHAVLAEAWMPGHRQRDRALGPWRCMMLGSDAIRNLHGQPVGFPCLCCLGQFVDTIVDSFTDRTSLTDRARSRDQAGRETSRAPIRHTLLYL